MKAPQRVPDPLKQKFLPVEDSFELEYAKVIQTSEGSELSVKYLMDCTGEFTNFAAFYCGNSLVVRKIRDGGLEAPHIFGDDLVVQDVDYLRSTDEGFEIVVALNSTKLIMHPHCVALLSWNGAKLRLIRKLKIEEEISCLKVTADEPLMEQLHDLLHPRMASWPHIIAVGTRLAHCYLFHFQLAERNTESGFAPKTVKLTDGLRPFHSGDDFIYTSVDPCTGNSFSKKFRLESVYVTCISFMEKSRTVLVGFSFGGIVTISLTTTPTIDPLVYPCGAAVDFITTLEPDDDPRSHLWFFVAYNTTKAKPLQLALYEVAFPDEEALPLIERTWNKPMFSIRLVIPFHNSMRWISAQTLVRDRADLRSGDESTRDSYRFGSDKDKSLMFFSYIGNDRRGCNLKGGLFDLNAYYYKRLVQIIAHDGTAAQQCAFLSTVHPLPILSNEEDYSLIKDIVVDPYCITRFISNVSDAEQMFYPSAYEMHVVHVAGAKKYYQLRVPSLPNQLLSTICADLEMHTKDATSASTWLAALGFPKKDNLAGGAEQYADLCSMLYALISHQRGGSIVQFIKQSDSTELRHLIASWIWEEVDKASKRMHETIEPLFARFSAPLSPAGQKSLAHVHDVFVAGVQILRELITTGEREQDQTKEYITSLEAQRFATENLKSYSLVIHQLIRSKILPVAEDREIRLAMEKAIEERRAKASGHQLYIDRLVSRMQRKSPSEPFWLAEGLKWYPPALLNLLGPILLLNIPAKWKGQLLAYYLFDYTNGRKLNGILSDSPSDLLDSVTKQMHGLLSMNKEELRSVYKSWCADAGTPLSEREDIEHCSPRKLSREAEIKHLMSIPRPLTAVEEEKLQALSNSAHYGEFVWQCYLAKCRKFDEFKELTIPPNDYNEFILEYQQLLPVVRMLRRCKDSANAPSMSWPLEIKQTIDSFERERHCPVGWYDTELPILSRGKTPKPLNKRKRQSMIPLQKITSPHTSTESDKTTSVAKRALFDLSEDESVLLPKNIPANTLNTITDLLRTPQARARAAAQAESQRKWTQTTPEGGFQKPVPRSILKSARGVSQGASSPSRNRLQFDLPSSSQSSLTQTSPITSPQHREKMAQPNFDESLEDEENYEGSSTTEECVEVEPEEFAPYISPSSSAEEVPKTAEDSDNLLERSIEVQDEDESDEEMETESSVVIVEGQDEEEHDAQHATEKVPILEDVQDTQEQRKNAGHQIMLVEEQVEQSVEQQDEDEDEAMGESKSVSASECLVKVVAVEQQEEEEGPKEGALVISISGELEDREEEGQSVPERLSFIEQEEQDEEEEPESMLVGRSSDSSYEIQEDDVQNPSVNIVRFESIVERTPGSDKGTGESTNGDERIEHVTRTIKIHSQFDDDVEIREVQDEYDEVATVLASGDYAAPAGRVSSSTHPADKNGDALDRIKLVDYSLHESTFESTPNAIKTKPSSGVEGDDARRTLQFDEQNDDELVGVETSTEILPQHIESSESSASTISPLPESGKENILAVSKSSEATEGEESQNLSPRAHDNLPVLQESRGTSRASSPTLALSPSPHPSESDLPLEHQNKRRSSRRVNRTPAPATPTRHSQRLREKAAESHILEETPEELRNADAHDVEVASVAGESRMSSPASRTEEIPHLTMSLRSRTPHGNEEVVFHEITPRKSPARGRRSAKEAEPTAVESSSTPTKEYNGDDVADIPARSLRPRTPSRSRQDGIPATPGARSRASRRISESSTSSEITAATTSLRKSPSRSIRTRKPSTIEEEAPTSSRKSPTRRTPTRSAMTPATAASETPGKTRASRALQPIANPSRDVDARTYFDTVLKKHLGHRSSKGSRRRTRSDSEVPEVKPLKLKKLDVDAIPEVDEESVLPTREHRKAVAQQAADSSQATTSSTRSPARSKRASSVTLAEATPGRTRRSSGSSVSSVGTSATPKSPSRRGRPKGIETIPE